MMKIIRRTDPMILDASERASERMRTDKSEFSRIYNETYYYKILVGITLSVRIAFINRRRLTYMALFSRLVCENTGNASTSDMGCCADSDDYSPTNFLGYTIIK